MKKYVALVLSIVMVAMTAFVPVEAEMLEVATVASIKAEPIRVRAEEPAMNTAVYDNGDGTYTLNVYGMDIKYVNQMGEVVDKSNRLVLDENNNYYNPDNDITVKLPQNLLAGVSLQYEDYNISLTPIVAAKASVERSVIQSPKKDITLNSLNSLNSSVETEVTSVEYRNVFSDTTNIRYTPMFNGIKEDIILEEYDGINEFVFALKTNGLEVSDTGGTAYLVKPDDQLVVGCISDIVIFDGAGKRTSGSLTITENIKAEKYELKVTAPLEFLTAKDTVYPVTVDPSYTFTVEVTGTGDKEIQDSPVYSGKPSLKPGVSNYNNVGCMTIESYGYARSLIKFPGLMEHIENLALTEDRITSVLYNTYCVEAGSNIPVHMYAYPGNTWDEGSVSYESSDMASASLSSSNLIDSVTVTGPSSTDLPKYSFDITDYVYDCLSGAVNPDKGVVLKNGNETNSARLVRFASTEYATSENWPDISITYTGLTSNDFCFYVYDAQTNEPVAGATVYAFRKKTSSGAYGVPTGYTTNAFGAVVFDKTELPYPNVYAEGYGINVVAADYAQYTSPSDDKLSGNTIHTVPMYKKSYYPSYNSPFATGEVCTTPDMTQHQHWGWRYMDDIDYHTGVDIAKSKGTPLYTVTNAGSIVYAGFTSGAGNYVMTLSNGNYVSYLHLDTITVASYTQYSSRTQVGTVGNTETIADHLHINVSSTPTIAKNARTFLDPLAFMPFGQ